MKRILIGLAMAGITFFPRFVRADQQPCSMKVKKLKQPKHLNPNSKATIEVELETVNCAVQVNLTGAGGRAPAFLWMKPSPGLGAKPLLIYTEFERVTHGAAEANAHLVQAHIALETSPEATPGKHSIEALLTYNAVDKAGNAAEGRFVFDIPIEVTARKPPGYWDKHPKLKKNLVTTGLVIVAIPLLPVWFVLSVLGVVSDC